VRFLVTVARIAILLRMATVLPSPVFPPSVQPGGGLCMRIELAWGKWRRSLLRRFRPGYVRRMLEKRQGECPECPHDIIDPRDLKFCRNVCGYWFHPQDDRFQWRGQLGFARAGLAELVLFSLVLLPLMAVAASGALLWHWVLWLPFAVALLTWLEVVWFFRDPERTIPADPLALVSPALRYFPGAFLDARRAESARRNEQLWIDLQAINPANQLVRVKQISGAIARRIVCWLKLGEEVKKGERLGMIKFGSRTDVLIAAGQLVAVQVKVGDMVHGGATVLLRF